MKRLCFLFSLALLFLAPSSVLACTCNIQPPACFEYWRTEVTLLAP
jgi:hypothetical protein